MMMIMLIIIIIIIILTSCIDSFRSSVPTKEPGCDERAQRENWYQLGGPGERWWSRDHQVHHREARRRQEYLDQVRARQRRSAGIHRGETH